MLSDVEKEQINEACNMAIELNNYKSKIFEYVESRMAFIAPNLSMIIGMLIIIIMQGLSSNSTSIAPVRQVLIEPDMQMRASPCIFRSAFAIPARILPPC